MNGLDPALLRELLVVGDLPEPLPDVPLERRRRFACSIDVRWNPFLVQSHAIVRQDAVAEEPAKKVPAAK